MPSDKSLIWVVILNSNDCRIYSYYKDSESVKLKLTKEISHPENKLRDIDLEQVRILKNIIN